jgi:hypothetical protein
MSIIARVTESTPRLVQVLRYTRGVAFKIRTDDQARTRDLAILAEAELIKFGEYTPAVEWDVEDSAATPVDFIHLLGEHGLAHTLAVIALTE